MTLLDEIQAKCSPAQIAARGDDGGLAVIAALVSAGRTRPSETMIGNGAVIRAIGQAAGNSFLDVIYTAHDFRYVKGLVDSGTLHASDPLVMGAIRAFVPAVLTQEQADALLSLAVVPNPASEHECSVAMQVLT